jgi:hypothetical protein
VLSDTLHGSVTFDEVAPVTQAIDQTTMCTQIREAKENPLPKIPDRYVGRSPMLPRRKRNLLLAMWCVLGLLVFAGGVQVYRMVRAKSTIAPSARS